MHEGVDLWAPSTRRRLVQFCSAITRDGQAAEDLAQETLLEAWRNAHKLRDPAGADRWLAAIARNVCLRWGRRRGRDITALAPLDEEAAVAGDVDFDAGLDRAELAELVDRALSELPADTRDVVVRRYVDERSNGEIADALGISADAVAMRLTRGKAVLRRVLATDRHGLADSHQWRPTRIWCSECGARKLLVRREPRSIAFRCPGCMEGTSSTGREFDLGNPFFASLFENLVRPTAVLARATAWSAGYFAHGERADCTRCGAPVQVRPYERPTPGLHLAERRGLYAQCERCGEAVSSSAASLALAQPEGRRFLRDHPRTRAAPVQAVESAGVPALVIGHRDVLGSARLDVVVARDTLRVLAVHRTAA